MRTITLLLVFVGCLLAAYGIVAGINALIGVWAR